ncbi:MAG TPA: HD domain-containing protein [Thermodesulfovibrionales bacterium]|nr:HD domain-containing protein [Thermodesulfovibrionales bacterium]
MDPLRIIRKYYHPETRAYYYLSHHSWMVGQKSLVIGRRMGLSAAGLRFVEEAAMLHDIGILVTNEPEIGCYGELHYACHGYAGREILEKEGLPDHALVSERHIGTGISLTDIEERKLALPKRDMRPVSIEEKIICFADKFFSKSPEYLIKEKPLEMIREGIAWYGEEKLMQFDEWLELFGA